jgi:hypothetical protein
MAKPSPKRKQKLQPISLAELESDPTMVGFTSLFRIPTTEQPLPHVASALPSPTVGDEVSPTAGCYPKPTVDSVSQHTVGFASSRLGTVASSLSPFFSSEDGKLYPHQRVRPLQEATDVLSRVELRVFEKLENLVDSHRHVRIGYDRLAEACSLNEKSVRLLLLRLIEKGFLSIIAPADPDRQLGKEYRLHRLEEAHRHHVERGWNWVVRSGNGILVVRPLAPTVGVMEKPTG